MCQPQTLQKFVKKLYKLFKGEEVPDEALHRVQIQVCVFNSKTSLLLLMFICYNLSRDFILQFVDYVLKDGAFKHDDGDQKEPRVYWKCWALAAPELAFVAKRLLAIAPHSAGLERMWSRMTSVHTKERNRLADERVLKLAKVGAAIKKREEGLIPKRPMSKKNKKEMNGRQDISLRI